MVARPRTKRDYLTLSYQDERILRSLSRYHYLLSRQLCRLLYSTSSLTYVQSRLKSLTDAGYCQRIWLPKRNRFGSAPAIYRLARKGMNHLSRYNGYTIGRYHPAEEELRSYSFLTHGVELNELLITAELLGRWRPEFRLVHMLHERELRRHPVYVTVEDGKQAAVIPDAWLDLRIQGSFQVCLAIELDRGTEEQKRWRQKVANLLNYANGPYQDAFDTRSLTIAVLTTAGHWRLRELLHWTALELEARHEASQSDLFLFSALPAHDMAIERVFFTPSWFQPFEDKPMALLEAPWVTY